VLTGRVLPIALILLAVLLGVLMVAWLDGGREDMHEIVQPVSIRGIGA